MQTLNENSSNSVKVISFHFTDITLYSEYHYDIFIQNKLLHNVTFFYEYGRPLYLNLYTYTDNYKRLLCFREIFDPSDFDAALVYLAEQLNFNNLQAAFSIIKKHISSYISFENKKTKKDEIIIEDELDRTVVRPSFGSKADQLIPSIKLSNYEGPNIQKFFFLYQHRNSFIVYYQPNPFYLKFDVTLEQSTYICTATNQQEFHELHPSNQKLPNSASRQLITDIQRIYNNIGMLQFYGPTPEDQTINLFRRKNFHGLSKKSYQDSRISEYLECIENVVGIEIPINIQAANLDLSSKNIYKKLLVLRHFITLMKEGIANRSSEEYQTLEQLHFLRQFLFINLYKLTQEFPMSQRPKNLLYKFIELLMDKTGLNTSKKEAQVTNFFKRDHQQPNLSELNHFEKYFPKEYEDFRQQITAIESPNLLDEQLSIFTSS